MKNLPTEKQVKNQFNKSLGSGVKSVFNTQGRKYYILEHRTHSATHKAGEVQEIIVDYIELGRDPKCQVRFGSDMPTVSRRHAAIYLQGDKWVIKHLSTSNPTLVNGRPVSKQWFLENGDEIQLSVEGPKIGFIVPPVNTVSSLGLSKRLSLFRQQALRPYKNAITALTVFLILTIAAGTYGIYQANKKTSTVIAEFYQFKQITQAEKDSLVRQLNASDERGRELARKISQMESSLIIRNTRPVSIDTSLDPNTNSADFTRFSALYPSVYQIYLEKLTINYQGSTETQNINSPIGSGFLLNDGRFVTARHVIEPWFYATPQERDLLYLNALVVAGARVTATFKAKSPSGSSFSFTNNDMTVDRSADRTESFTDEEGNRLALRLAPLAHPSDWASMRSNQPGGLVFDNQLSNNLTIRTQLDVLGYPLGITASNGRNISPIYGSCTVGADGLQNGIILISARNFEHGNSGGPVFVNNNGQYVVVGIISAGTGDNIGFIVPISAVK